MSLREVKALANSSDRPQRLSKTRSGKSALVDMERELQEKDLQIEQLKEELAFDPVYEFTGLYYWTGLLDWTTIRLSEKSQDFMLHGG